VVPVGILLGELFDGVTEKLNPLQIVVVKLATTGLGLTVIV
jgi:hypothetical protein